MLVLVIILRGPAPRAAVTIKVKLPPAAAKPAPNPPTPIYISIKKDGRIYVGDFATDIDSLGDDLKRQVGRRNPSKERLFIRGDQDMMYQDFMPVRNQARANSFAK